MTFVPSFACVVVILLKTTVIVNAFSPPTTTARSTTTTTTLLHADLSSISGGIKPAGNFDPLQLASKVSDTELRRYRECEVMHGRFAMMAVLGFLVPEKFAYDGTTWGTEMLAPHGSALDVFQSSPELVYLTLGLVAGLETLRLTTTEPGRRTDALLKELNLGPTFTDDERSTYEVNELSNGRLAMLAIAGEVAQELVHDQGLWATIVEKGYANPNW